MVKWFGEIRKEILEKSRTNDFECKGRMANANRTGVNVLDFSKLPLTSFEEI